MTMSMFRPVCDGLLQGTVALPGVQPDVQPFPGTLRWESSTMKPFDEQLVPSMNWPMCSQTLESTFLRNPYSHSKSSSTHSQGFFTTLRSYCSPLKHSLVGRRRVYVTSRPRMQFRPVFRPSDGIQTS